MLKPKYQDSETFYRIENLMKLLEDERGNGGIRLTSGIPKAIDDLSFKLSDNVCIDRKIAAREILTRLEKIRKKEPDKLTGLDALVAIDAGNVR